MEHGKKGRSRKKENLTRAIELGIHVIHFRSNNQLFKHLKSFSVK